MASFGIRFFISNIFLALLIGIIIFLKRILKNFMSKRIQYNLWFLLFVLLAVPFLPFELHGLPELFPILETWLIRRNAAMGPDSLQLTPETGPASALEQINDFAISVSSKSPSQVSSVIVAIWGIGMLAMTVLLIRSWKQLRRIEKSALLLEKEDVYKIYENC